MNFSSLSEIIPHFFFKIGIESSLFFVFHSPFSTFIIFVVWMVTDLALSPWFVFELSKIPQSNCWRFSLLGRGLLLFLGLPFLLRFRQFGSVFWFCLFLDWFRL